MCEMLMVLFFTVKETGEMLPILHGKHLHHMHIFSPTDKACRPAVDARMQGVCVPMKSHTTRRENIYSKFTVSDRNPFR